MKDRTSKLLTAIIADINKPPRQTKADKKLLDFLADYPFNFREPVYCWLWANHAQVLDLRSRLVGFSWQGIAMIMREDEVVGSRGEPPNANSVRRVWGRVCRDIKEQKAREVREQVNGWR